MAKKPKPRDAFAARFSEKSRRMPSEPAPPRMYMGSRQQVLPPMLPPKKKKER